MLCPSEEADEPELPLAVKEAPEWPDYRSSPSNFVFRRHGSVIEKDDYRKEGIEYINQLDWEIRV